MENCKLCNLKPADKKGSHIVPHFLLIGIDGFSGSRARGKDLGFTIGKSDTKTHIGREVLPEEYQEIFGEITDEEIPNMKNQSIVDYFFCSSCETRLSQLEGEYSKTTFKFDTKNIYKSNTSNGMAFLFWMSIVWRMALIDQYGLHLLDEEKEQLRAILNKYLCVKFNEINFDELTKDVNCKNLAYRLIRCPNYSKEKATILLAHPENSKPYSFIIDEYVLLFYFALKDVDTIDQSFFGVENIIKDVNVNTITNGEYIYPVNEELFAYFIDGVLKVAVNQRMTHFNDLFDSAHKMLGGKGSSMPQIIKQEIMNQITSEEKIIGRRYTEEDTIKSMWTVLKKHIK